ncbi:MAG: hypothetical protein H7X70_06090 [Candidatus Kapabacteria bacterium]|nr:hypothetical protein [Candidatus Kapabacteria bacterium]
MTTTMYKRFLVTAAICTMWSMTVWAQQANLNVEGFVRDEVTGQPVGCKIFIFAPSGKRITITSNSKDGSYLQTLSESGTHKFAMSGYNIYRKEVNIEIPVAQKYRVIKQDITVRLVVEGVILSTSQHGFDRNSASLSEQGRKQIAEMADVLRVNQEMNVVVSIAADEDQRGPMKAKADAEYKKQYDAWVKAAKKVKKGKTPPVEPTRPVDPIDPNVQLLQDRINTVKQLVKEVKAGDVRISYNIVQLPISTVPTPATPVAVKSKKKGKKGSSAVPASPAPPSSVASHLATLTVKVGKVKKLYD